MADEEFDELLEQSSLGSPAARQLRARIASDQVALTRRIADLRNRMVHGSQARAKAAAAELHQLLLEHNYQASAAGERGEAPEAVIDELPPDRRPIHIPLPVAPLRVTSNYSDDDGHSAAVSVAVLPGVDVDDQEARRLVRELRDELVEIDVVPVLTAPGLGGPGRRGPGRRGEADDVQWDLDNPWETAEGVNPVLSPVPARDNPVSAFVEILSVATTTTALPALVNTMIRWLKRQRHQPRVSLTINSITIEVMGAMSDEDLSHRLHEYLSRIDRSAPASDGGE